MDDCLFCKIAAGDIPASIVYQDDVMIAFEDINPKAPVHTLLIPRQHYHNLSDEIPAELLGELFAKVHTVAALKGIEESVYRIIVNSGVDARQLVQHLHIHVLGGMTLPISAGTVD